MHTCRMSVQVLVKYSANRPLCVEYAAGLMMASVL